jgi:hypothetical protein
VIRLTLDGPNAEPLYVLGITQMEVDRLVAGVPIKVELEELGGADTVVILAAADVEGLRQEVAKVISPDELARLTPMFDQLGAVEREMRRATGGRT